MIDVKDKVKCCGCGACFNACRVGAIQMQEDEYGFVFPKVEVAQCVQCGLCESVCPEISNVAGSTPQEVYAAVLKDEEKLRSSASGGVAFGTAKTFLESGGVAYGCAFDEALNPECRRVDTLEELPLLQGSKYVQSDMGRTFLAIQKDLTEGRKVLFFGVPCQVAAVRAFIKKQDADKLTTVDLVCHGVPSRRFWKDYVALLGKQSKGKVVSFTFRHKGAKSPFYARYQVLKKNGKLVARLVPSSLSTYYYYFLSGAVYRQSCYQCPFASDKRTSDVTIADYWGYDSHKLDSKNGISAVLVNTEKGKSFFAQASQSFNLEKKTFEDVAKNNEQLRRPSSIKKFQQEVLDYWKKNGMRRLNNRYLLKHWKAWILHKLGVL